MLHKQFWNSFGKQSHDLANGKITQIPPSARPTRRHTSFKPKEKYEYLSEYGTQILCLMEVNEGCQYLSRNFGTITGHARTQFTGTAFYNLLHEDQKERLLEILSSNSLEHSPYPFRCKLQHADEKYYWYLFLIHPKEDGKDGEFVCIIENIHDNMLTQNSLQKSRLEAELALRTRSEFLANMSHELRTPLNAIIGFAQIIESGIFGKVENTQYNEYIRHIHESGHDLLSKIEDLLEISSIDAGHANLSQEKVYMHDILNHVLDAQMHHADAAQVKLEIGPQESELLLHVDRLKLQHILGHLLANAIRCSHVGGNIKLSATVNESGKLEINVSDTGIGMPENKLNAIILALQEDHCWTTGDNHVIGLGLALTREFVSLHGGHVDITSHAGVGTSITITLPDNCIRSTVVQHANYAEQAVS